MRQVTMRLSEKELEILRKIAELEGYDTNSGFLRMLVGSFITAKYRNPSIRETPLKAVA